MATKHPSSELPNSPNYYWAQSLDTFDKWASQRYHNDNLRSELYMWLFLYEMAISGE